MLILGYRSLNYHFQKINVCQALCYLQYEWDLHGTHEVLPSPLVRSGVRLQKGG